MIRPGIYQHHRGHLYNVLGMAAVVAMSAPIQLDLGPCRHTETSAVGRLGAMGALLVARFEPDERMPPIEAVVVYMALYLPDGPAIFVRPLTVWSEEVEVKTAYGDRRVPRFSPVAGRVG